MTERMNRLLDGFLVNESRSKGRNRWSMDTRARNNKQMKERERFSRGTIIENVPGIKKKGKKKRKKNRWVKTDNNKKSQE